MTGEPVRAPEALPGATGTRARSRELGYAEAMRQMGWMLRTRAESWGQAEITAAELGNMQAAATIGHVAYMLEEYAFYAFSAFRLAYHDHRRTPVWDLELLAAWERQGYTHTIPRRELPGPVVAAMCLVCGVNPVAAPDVVVCADCDHTGADPAGAR